MAAPSSPTTQLDTPSRKRVRSEKAWKCSKRKTARNSGKEYTTKSGKEVGEKEMDERSCACALKCSTKLTMEQMRKIFMSFWELSSFDVQNAYLCGSVKMLPVKRHTSPTSNRGNTRVYYVNNGDRSIRVCKVAFLHIHGISNGRLTRILEAQSKQGGVPRLDRRGCHEPPNKTSQEDLDFISQHIESFPVYESHYSRSDNPNLKYLSPHLTVAKMYVLYKERCTEEGQMAASEWIYRKRFNENYNLSFGRLKSDTCKMCDSMKVRLEAETDPGIRTSLSGQWELHKRKAERCYQQLREDTALAKSDLNTDTITFDLQQSLPTPVLTVNVVYYKRQLWTYNLGIHCCSTGVGHMHMWNETQASRGSQDILSCVSTYLKEHRMDVKHLIAFSDSCGGQNRNINFVCFWQHVVASADYSYEVVDHKFMICGHSYLPNDRDFGGIESARRRTSTLYVPEDWCTLVARARKVNPFQVRIMLDADFVSTEELTSMIVNRKVDTANGKVEWLNIHWIRAEKTCPLSFKFRNTCNELEPWKTVDLRPKRAGRLSDMGRVELAPLYSGRRAINPAKLRDLQQLLCYVPPIHHDFYKALIAETPEKDP